MASIRGTDAGGAVALTVVYVVVGAVAVSLAFWLGLIALVGVAVWGVVWLVRAWREAAPPEPLPTGTRPAERPRKDGARRRGYRSSYGRRM